MNKIEELQKEKDELAKIIYEKSAHVEHFERTNPSIEELAEEYELVDYDDVKFFVKGNLEIEQEHKNAIIQYNRLNEYIYEMEENIRKKLNLEIYAKNHHTYEPGNTT